MSSTENRRMVSVARFVLALLIGLATAAGPLEAWAQDGADKQAVMNALKLIREANAAFEAEEYEEAYATYGDAYELYPAAELLLRLGECAEAVGETTQAVEHYEAFLEAKPDDKASAKLRGRLPELRAALPGVIDVSTEPPGARVYLGEVSEEAFVGEAPLQVEASPGDVTVVVSADGYVIARQDLEVAAGSASSVSLELRRIDDVGDEEVVEEEEGGREGMSLGVWGWSATGAGLALVGTGAVFSLMSQSAEEDANDYNKRAFGASRAELEDLQNVAIDHYNTSVALYVAGGVVAATGAGLLTYQLLKADESGTASLQIGAGVGTNSGWVGVRGRF